MSTDGGAEVAWAHDGTELYYRSGSDWFVVSVTATDTFGNAGSDATANELRIDTEAPTVTVDSLDTNDSTPELSGTVNDASATIVVTGQPIRLH